MNNKFKFLLTLNITLITIFCSGKTNKDFDIDYFGKKFIEVLQTNDSLTFYEEFQTKKETYVKWINIFLESDFAANKLGFKRELPSSEEKIEQTMQINQWGFDGCYKKIKNWIDDDSINVKKLEYKYSILEGSFFTNDISIKSRLHVVIEHNNKSYMFDVINPIYIEGKYSCSSICFVKEVDGITEEKSGLTPLLAGYFDDFAKELNSLDSTSFFAFAQPKSKEVSNNTRKSFLKLKDVFNIKTEISVIDYIYSCDFNDSSRIYICDEVILIVKSGSKLYKLNITDLQYIKNNWVGIRINQISPY